MSKRCDSDKHSGSWAALMVAGVIVGAAVVYVVSDKSRRETAVSCIQDGSKKAACYVKKTQRLVMETVELIPRKKKKTKETKTNNPWQEVDLFLNENN